VNGEIIELEGEPEPAPAPWRPGSLTIVVAPLLGVVIIAVALWSAGRPTSDVAAPSARPTATPLGIEFYSLPPGIIATRPPSDVVSSNGETGEPEMLQNDPWMGVGPTYSGRGDVAEAVLYGDAYVIGGSGSSADGRQVYRYDRRTGMRIRAADLPVSLDHAMAATLGDRIYVMGGFEFGRATARVFSLGVNDSAWVEHSPMPAARAAGGAVTLSGRIWIVGGVGADGDWIRDIWGWNGSAQWAHRLALLPTPRDHLAVGTYKGRICAAGGNGGERAFECYSPVRNEWTRMPDLRKPTIGARSAEAAGWFWVIAQDVHIFTEDHWHFGPRLLTPRSGHAAVVIDDAIYVIEGAQGIPTARMERITPHP
jgi:hypothetical protein